MKLATIYMTYFSMEIFPSGNQILSINNSRRLTKIIKRVRAMLIQVYYNSFR